MSLWNRALATSKNSATHFVANVTIFASAALEVASQFGDQLIQGAGDLLQDPELKVQLKMLIPSDKWPLAMIFIAIMVKVARNRSLGK
jgi:hypothetical protein